MSEPRQLKSQQIWGTGAHAAGQRERVRVAARHAREPDVSDAEHVPRDPREEAP